MSITRLTDAVDAVDGGRKTRLWVLLFWFLTGCREVVRRAPLLPGTVCDFSGFWSGRSGFREADASWRCYEPVTAVLAGIDGFGRRLFDN